MPSNPNSLLRFKMSSHIDFRTLPVNVPILCIPRVYSNISEGRIRKIFDDLDMGTLERIDIVSKSSEKGEKFNRVFVHFRCWNNSDNANTARERLLNGKEIKIIYDDPWFWKISAYREAERKPIIHSGGSRKATIAFDSDEEKPSRPVVKEHRQDKTRWSKPVSQASLLSKPVSQASLLDNRPRQHNDKPKATERKFIEPRSPSNSPPRERLVDNELSHESVTEVPIGESKKTA